MVGIGGPQHLVTAPTGDRVTTASSSGSGGGIIDVGSSTTPPRATTEDEQPDPVGGGAVLNAGGNLSVTTNTLVNDVATGQNGGGGLVSVGKAEATASGSSNGTLTVAGGAQLTAGADLTVSATTNVDVNSIASSSNVGLGSGVETHTHTTLSFTNSTSVDGILTAAFGRIKVEAHSNTDGESSSKFLGRSPGSVPTRTRMPTSRSTSTTEVDLQGDARLHGVDVEVNARLS